MRIAVRLFRNGVLYEEQELDANADELAKLAERHVELCIEEPTNVEIEFLDEPDPNHRFFRIGTDPLHMVKPREIKPDVS